MSTDKEEWLRYFNEELGVHVNDKDLIVQSWKGFIWLDSIDSFQEAAQARSVKNLQINANGCLTFNPDFAT